MRKKRDRQRKYEEAKDEKNGETEKKAENHTEANKNHPSHLLLFFSALSPALPSPPPLSSFSPRGPLTTCRSREDEPGHISGLSEFPQTTVLQLRLFLQSEAMKKRKKKWRVVRGAKEMAGSWEREREREVRKGGNQFLEFSHENSFFL